MRRHVILLVSVFNCHCCVCTSTAIEGSSLEGRTVTIVEDWAELTSSGNVIAYPDLGESFQIERDDGERLWIKSREAYLKRSSVVLYQDAIDLFTKRIKEDPKSDAFDDRGRCWRKRGAIDLAIRDFDEAIRLDPSNVHVYLNRGNAWVDKGSLEKSLADFSEAIRLEPNDAAAFNNRGTTWIRMQQYEKAIADFDKAIRLDPKHAKAYENRGLARLQNNERDKALADINEAIRLNPHLAGAYRQRALLWLKKHDYEKVLIDIDRAIELDPKRASAYATRAQAHAGIGDFEKAVEDFKTMIQIDPAAGYNDLAWMRATCPNAKFRDPKQAIQAATRACELTDWQNDAYLDTLSAALAESGQFEEAIKKLARAMKMNPGNAKKTREKMMDAYKGHRPYRDDST